jgi:hypothetical protein
MQMDHAQIHLSGKSPPPPLDQGDLNLETLSSNWGICDSPLPLGVIMNIWRKKGYAKGQTQKANWKAWERQTEKEGWLETLISTSGSTCH